MYSLPPFIHEATQGVQGVRLSRETINNVLSKHGVNGYPCKHKRWKFFRAKEPDELWQIDFKGPFIVHGKKYWFFICIDDYSRFLVVAEQFSHEPKTREVIALLEEQNRLPKAILSDHGQQFKENWKRWCRQHSIEPHFAHPSYPQDKGKVERCLQNLNREFVNHLRKFPGWLKGRLYEYREWFNHSRFHRGINTLHAELYECNVSNLTSMYLLTLFIAIALNFFIPRLIPGNPFQARLHDRSIDRVIDNMKQPALATRPKVIFYVS